MIFQTAPALSPAGGTPIDEIAQSVMDRVMDAAVDPNLHEQLCPDRLTHTVRRTYPNVEHRHM